MFFFIETFPNSSHFFNWSDLRIYIRITRTLFKKGHEIAQGVKWGHKVVQIAPGPLDAPKIGAMLRIRSKWEICSEIYFWITKGTILLKNRSINFGLIKTKLEHHLATFLPRNAPILSQIFLILSQIVPILLQFDQLFSCPDFYLDSLKALNCSCWAIFDFFQFFLTHLDLAINMLQ